MQWQMWPKLVRGMGLGKVFDHAIESSRRPQSEALKSKRNTNVCDR